MKKPKRKEKIKGMSRKKKALLLLLCLLLIAGIAFAVHRHSAQPAEEGTMMETAAAEVMDISKKVSSKGEIKSALDEKITPHASYKLEKIAIQKGEEVKEGDTILFYTNGTSMTAPYNCVVKDWSLPDRNKVLSNDHYVEIESTDVLKMELSVSEDKIMLVKKGQPARITVKAADKTYDGEVTFISDIGEYMDGTSELQVDVLFDNDGSLKLGMNGKARIVLGQVKDVIGVPVDAVYDDGEASYVTVLKEDGTQKDVKVTTGFENSKYIEIKSGLKEGDQIVVPTDDSENEEYFMY